MSCQLYCLITAILFCIMFRMRSGFIMTAPSLFMKCVYSQINIIISTLSSLCRLSQSIYWIRSSVFQRNTWQQKKWTNKKSIKRTNSGFQTAARSTPSSAAITWSTTLQTLCAAPSCHKWRLWQRKHDVQHDDFHAACLLLHRLITYTTCFMRHWHLTWRIERFLDPLALFHIYGKEPIENILKMVGPYGWWVDRPHLQWNR